MPGGRDAAARSFPWLVGRLVDEWGRRVNAHRLPTRRRSQGMSHFNDVHICSKGGGEACAVRKEPHDSAVLSLARRASEFLCCRFGHGCAQAWRFGAAQTAPGAASAEQAALETTNGCVFPGAGSRAGSPPGSGPRTAACSRGGGYGQVVRQDPAPGRPRVPGLGTALRTEDVLSSRMVTIWPQSSRAKRSPRAESTSPTRATR